MSGSSVVHCMIISIFSGFIYGYNTGIVAGISKPATLGFFNSTFLDKETESCVQIENKPGAMSTSASPSSMAALEGLAHIRRLRALQHDPVTSLPQRLASRHTARPRSANIERGRHRACGVPAVLQPSTRIAHTRRTKANMCMYTPRTHTRTHITHTHVHVRHDRSSPSCSHALPVPCRTQ